MIDPESIVGLNIITPGGAMAAFKPFARRLEDTPVLKSDVDEEIIITVRFTSPCHVRKMMFIGGGEDASHPFTVKCYVNHEGIDFSSVEDFTPAATFANLGINKAGTAEQFATPASKFTNIDVLTFYFCENHGDASTIVQYIGMQGEHTHYRREAVDAEYEVLCNGQDITQPEDSKTAAGLNKDGSGF
jgi:hypothetical protein